jgi:hypothetical protein
MSVQYMRGLTILQAATAYTNGDRGYAAYLSDQVHDFVCKKCDTLFCT